MNLLSLCESTVDGLSSRGGYNLLEKDEFLHLVYERACNDNLENQGDVSEQIKAISKNVYAHALYSACRSDNPQKQNKAYQELSIYLYRIAFNYLMTRGCPPKLAETQAEDNVQEALMNIHRNINQVQQPGYFLEYCIQAVTRICGRSYHWPVQKLADFLLQLSVSDSEVREHVERAAQQLRRLAETVSSGSPQISAIIKQLEFIQRIDQSLQKPIGWLIRQVQRTGREISETDLDEDEWSEWMTTIPMMSGCRLDCVLEVLGQIDNKDQRMVLILQFFSEFNDSQIATVLRTVRNNIYQLRRRALQSIDRDWLASCLDGC